MMKTPEQKKKERHAIRMIALVSQIGITMMVPVFLCAFAGRLISERTGHPILFLILLLIGILAGFRSSWQVISRFTGLSLRGGKESDGDSRVADHQDDRYTSEEEEEDFFHPERDND